MNDLQHFGVEQKKCFHWASGFQTYYLKSYSNCSCEIEHAAMELETSSVQKNLTSWKPDKSLGKNILPTPGKHTYSVCVCVCVCISSSVVSDSLRPHGLQFARLLCPWDSSGKNTRVGCHSLLQGCLPNPEIKPRYPALQAVSLPGSHQGRPSPWLRNKERRKLKVLEKRSERIHDLGHLEVEYYSAKVHHQQ